MATRHDRKVSILDVMGPVMVGPSSSHTAGTSRLGRVAREILDEDPVEVHFFLHPPRAATYRGHGSDFALVGGRPYRREPLGAEWILERFPASLEHVVAAGDAA